MKYIYSADWHLAFKKPRIRTDDYSITQYEKAKWICQLANKKEACLVIAGDIFDKPSCPIPWLHAYISLFNTVKRKVFVIYGQHDIHFHNPDLSRTPLGVLLASGSVRNADEIYDVCNFGENIPLKSRSTHLCIHAPITKYAPPFFMEDAVSASEFLEKHTEWKYIVSGDYHEQHVTELDGRILFNPGPITRPSKDKINFIPAVIFHDTRRDWEWIKIPCKKDVFNLDMMDKDDRTDYKQKFREFAGSIDSGSVKQNFHENLKLVINKSGVKEEALEIIDKVMEKVNV